MLKSVETTNRSCNAVVDFVDEGSDYSSGRINILDADSTIITYLPLSLPAFRDSTDGTAVANTIYDNTAFRDATAALFDVINRDGSSAWSGTVSTFSGVGDLKLNAVVLYQDSTVSLSSAFYAVPR
ncbi:hypothetical protein DRQ07_02890 [candidate division KSB1 bacterium]|nr:MAG: hypothetical protein DRQ07_02890 [candidate division KSB1 bacterium]